MKVTRTILVLPLAAALLLVTGCDDGGSNCPSGQVDCNGLCVLVTSDPNNCGVCGNVCGAGESCCAGACADYLNDASNCGSCGNACNPGETCTNGTCGTPGPEACNNQDDDGDGQIDEGLTRACDNPCGRGTETCVAGRWEDCTAPEPSDEVCDGEDNDCDGQTDEGVTVLFYRDGDGDGFGDPDTTAEGCEGSPPEGYVADHTDCDDGDDSVNPGTPLDSESPDLCDGEDNDCDGTADEGCSCTLGDIQECGEGGDTGECEWGVQECVNRGGGPEWDECIRDDDEMPHPETCDGLDNDCDGETDEGMPGDSYEINDECGTARGPIDVIEGEDPITITANLYSEDGSQDEDWFRLDAVELDDLCVPLTSECGYDFVLTFAPPEGTAPEDWELCLEARPLPLFGSVTCDDAIEQTFCTTADDWDDASGQYGLVVSWDGTCGDEDGVAFYTVVRNIGSEPLNVCQEYEIQAAFVFEERDCAE